MAGPYNWNHGWGRIIANALAQKQRTGKVLIVCAATNSPHYQNLNEIYSDYGGKAEVTTTLQAAIDLAGDGDGDTIFVAPNHTENIASAGAIDTGTDTAGLTIIGLGDADERPLYTFITATTADIDIGSNGVTFENIRFDLTGIDALAQGFDVNDAGFTLRNCEFIVADQTGQATTAIVTDANADRLLLENCQFTGPVKAGTNTAVRLVGGDFAVIKDCYFEGAYKLDAGAIEVTTTAAGYLRIENCIINNTTEDCTAAINFVQGTTATVVGCALGIRSGTNPVRINLGTGSPGFGSVTCSGNYYSAVTTITAGTLL